jgi:cellulose synthase operon protein YhjU
MGYWSFYFLAKLLLYAGGHLDFHVGLNLVLAAFAALQPANARQHRAKNLLAVPLGVMLLYHDSWLPPFGRVLVQAPQLANFSMPYLLELTARLIDLRAALELLFAFGLFVLLRRKLRMATFVFAGMLAVAVVPPPGSAPATPRNDQPRPGPVAALPVAGRSLSSTALDATLKQFYAREADRLVRPPTSVAGDPYDIIVLHVCSLAWDDLRAVGLQNDAFLKRFDILFTHFNSAASYSGPATIRLLRGNCGQPAHRELYTAPPSACFVIAGLERAGFEPHWLMNHDGHYANFYADVRLRGGLEVALEPTAGAVVAQHAFDGTPILSDYSVLSRWWERRVRSDVPRVVLYYNTISLHDGNRQEGKPSGSHLESFGARTAVLFADLGRFLDQLRQSRRHVVVVFIPEHGAAVRGERRQLQGLREVPSPAITQVPVGVALLGAPAERPAGQQTVDAPTSYLAISALLARLVAEDPFADRGGALPSSLVQNLPQTTAVAENEGTVMLDAGGDNMMRTPDGEWSVWDSTPQ